jgi:ribulose-5-phosphate 4-epimerase/fuculose-1-phosphate aldolase
LPAYQSEALLRETRLARDNRTIQAEKTAHRLKQRPFLVLKTFQMFARGHGLISSGRGLREIYIRHHCMQSLFLDGPETGGCQLAFAHRRL